MSMDDLWVTFPIYVWVSGILHILHDWTSKYEVFACSIHEDNAVMDDNAGSVDQYPPVSSNVAGW